MKSSSFAFAPFLAALVLSACSSGGSRESTSARGSNGAGGATSTGATSTSTTGTGASSSTSATGTGGATSTGATGTGGSMPTGATGSCTETTAGFNLCSQYIGLSPAQETAEQALCSAASGTWGTSCTMSGALGTCTEHVAGLLDLVTYYPSPGVTAAEASAFCTSQGYVWTAGMGAASATSSTSGTGGTGGTAAAGSGGAGVADPCGADLQTDPHNCGSCGHDCSCGACQAGVCQPWVVQPQADEGSNAMTALTADGQYVVWGADLAVAQSLPGGGPEITLSSTSGLDVELPPAIVSGTVAFIDGSTLYTLPEGTTVPTAAGTVPSGTSVWANLLYPAYSTLASRGDSVFFITQSDSAPADVYLASCPIGGTGGCSSVTSTKLDSQEDPVLGPYVTQTSALWFDDAFNPSSALLHGWTFSTMTQTSPVKIGDQVVVAAVDAQNVYWVEASTADTVHSLPVSLQGTPKSVVSLGITIEALASDGTYLYIASPVGVSYVPIGGGSPTALYTQPGGLLPMSVAVAGGAVFWELENQNACPPQWSVMGIAAP